MEPMDNRTSSSSSNMVRLLAAEAVLAVVVAVAAVVVAVATLLLLSPACVVLVLVMIAARACKPLFVASIAWVTTLLFCARVELVALSVMLCLRALVLFLMLMCSVLLRTTMRKLQDRMRSLLLRMGMLPLLSSRWLLLCNKCSRCNSKWLPSLPLLLLPSILHTLRRPCSSSTRITRVRMCSRTTVFTRCRPRHLFPYSTKCSCVGSCTILAHFYVLLAHCALCRHALVAEGVCAMSMISIARL